MKCPDRARSFGSRKALAAPVWVRSGRHSGGMAARRTDRNRAATNTSCRARCCWARCARALSAKLRDGELRVVREFKLADHKTKNMIKVLATLEAKKTVLLVENGENTNLRALRRTLRASSWCPAKK